MDSVRTRPVSSPRRGGSFVSQLPEVPGIRCPWDIAARAVADDALCTRVSETTVVAFIRRHSSTATMLMVREAKELRPGQLESVRVPSAHVGMPNYIGVLVVPQAQGGSCRGVWYESFNEMHHLLDLIVDGIVLDVVTQPLRFEWRFPKAGVREHTPDFLVVAHGRVTLVDVTRAEKLAEDPATLTIFALTAETCRRLGWGYEVRTELPVQRCRNLRFLAGFRNSPGLRSVPASATSMSPATVGELERWSGNRAAALQQIADGEWHVDLAETGPRLWVAPTGQCWPAVLVKSSRSTRPKPPCIPGFRTLVERRRTS